MKRTIRQAKAILEEAAPGLNPAMYRRYADEVKQAEQAATQLAHGHARQKASKLLTQRKEVERQLCETRDGFKALVQEKDRLTAQEYAERFNTLKGEERRLQAIVGDVEAGLATVQAIEEDPVTYADETFYAKTPTIRPDFTFKKGEA